MATHSHTALLRCVLLLLCPCCAQATLFQNLFSATLALFFLVIHLRDWPYVDNSLNLLRAFTDVQVFMVYFIALILRVSESTFADEAVKVQGMTLFDKAFYQSLLGIILGSVVVPIVGVLRYRGPVSRAQHTLLVLASKTSLELQQLEELFADGDTGVAPAQSTVATGPSSEKAEAVVEHGSEQQGFSTTQPPINTTLQRERLSRTRPRQNTRERAAATHEPDTPPSIPLRQQAIEEPQRRRAASVAAPQWIQRFDPSTERAYYEHVATKKTQWTHPGVNLLTGEPLSETEEEENPVFAMSAADLNAARESVAKTKEAAMWKRLRDGNGRVYYFNERTKQTQWAVPELLKQHQEMEEQWEPDDGENTAEI